MRERVLGRHRLGVPCCFCRLVAPYGDAVAWLKLAFWNFRMTAVVEPRLYDFGAWFAVMQNPHAALARRK
jgi:hypothetical protein